MLSLENLVSFWCLIHTFIYAFIYFFPLNKYLWNNFFTSYVSASLLGYGQPEQSRWTFLTLFQSLHSDLSFFFFFPLSFCLLRILQSFTGGCKLGCDSESPAEGVFRGLLFGIYTWYVVLTCCSCVQLFVTPWTVAHQASLSWDSPGKNTGVGCYALLQGIFLTQGSNLHLYAHLSKTVSLAGMFSSSVCY